MKKMMMVLALVLTTSIAALAQNYGSAVGGRLTRGLGATYKTHIGQKGNALEGIAYFGIGGNSYFDFTLLYEVQNDLGNAERLQWYYGGGPSVGTYFGNDGGLLLGINGIVGLEYTFKFPVVASLDYKPRVNLSGIGFGDFTGLALSARYILK